MKKYKKKLILFSLLFFTGFTSPVYAQNQKPIYFKDLTIVVSSCDKYQELWDPFFIFLFKNWPSLKNENNHIPIFLITNEKNYPDSRVTVIKTAKDKNWSSNMLKALKNVKSKYVLYLQEDFIIYLPIKEAILQKLLLIMQQEKPAYIELV